MTKGYISSLEEVFVEKNFEFGDDEDTLSQNYEAASTLYFKSLEQTTMLVDDIIDGIAVDKPSAILAIQNLVFSKKYKDQFNSELKSLNTKS